MTFVPVPRLPGRLLRLGIVLDTRNAPIRLREIARMCDRAGLDSLWIKDHLMAPDGEPRLEAWTAATLAAVETHQSAIGVMCTQAFRPPGLLGAMAGTLDVASGGRLQLGLSSGRVEAEHRAFGFDYGDTATRASELERYTVAVRTLLAGGAGTAELFGMEGAELGVASPQPGGPRISIEATTEAEIRVAIAVADDVVIPSASAHDVDGVVHGVSDACRRAGRDPATIGIAMEMPVSIGRTPAEAHARADAEPVFSTIGHPALIGIFGTLEQCQDRVIELAHAGVTELRCILPNAPDVHDAIAQLTAMVVGSVNVLSPGAPRSPSPGPPEGWGGRSLRD